MAEKQQTNPKKATPRETAILLDNDASGAEVWTSDDGLNDWSKYNGRGGGIEAWNSVWWQCASPVRPANAALSDFSDGNEPIMAVTSKMPEGLCEWCLENLNVSEVVVIRRALRIAVQRGDGSGLSRKVTVPVLVAFRRTLLRTPDKPGCFSLDTQVYTVPMIEEADMWAVEQTSTEGTVRICRDVLRGSPWDLPSILAMFGDTCRHNIKDRCPFTCPPATAEMHGPKAKAGAIGCTNEVVACRKAQVLNAFRNLLAKKAVQMYSPICPFAQAILSVKRHVDHKCDWCKKTDSCQRCSKCEMQQYCSRACQKAAWSTHKAQCS
jgi:hypothetical protein